MTALAAARESKKKDGKLTRHLMKASTQIWKHSLTMIDTSGLLVPGSDTSGYLFAGVAYESALSAASGSTYCRVEKSGSFEFVAASATQAWVGVAVYAVDDQTVALAATTTNDVLVGYVEELISSTAVRVRIDLAAK